MAHLKVEINEESNVDLDMTGNPYDLIDALATCMEQNDVIAAIVIGAKEAWESKSEALALNGVRLSLLECKDKIAEIYGKDDWNAVLHDFEYGLGISKLIGFEDLMDKVAELYKDNEA